MVPGEACSKTHEPLAKLKLKTFSDTKKRSTIASNNKQIELNADTELFGQMILVNQNRNLDIRAVLKHPLGPIPFSIGKPDGELASTAKAELANSLQAVMPLESNVPG